MAFSGNQEQNAGSACCHCPLGVNLRAHVAAGLSGTVALGFTGRERG